MGRDSSQGRTILSDDQECRFISIGKLVLSAEDTANISAFAPPSKECQHWRLYFKNGDVGMTDGNVIVTYGKKDHTTGTMKNNLHRIK